MPFKGRNLVFCFIFLFLLFSSYAKVCAIYFTGVGCPHCAKTDPVLLKDLLKKYPELVIIEYEIYQQMENSGLLFKYNEKYSSGLGIPLIIFNEDDYIIGDNPILENVESYIEKYNNKNPCLLLDGKIKFEDLNINALPGKPKIWYRERILVKKDFSENEKVKELLLAESVEKKLKEFSNVKVVDAEDIPLSGDYVKFRKAVMVSNWLLQWNDINADINISNNDANKINGANTDKNSTNKNAEAEKQNLTIAKIISLAAVDAVNPCALAVLTLMLIAILSYNPQNKKKVLFAGLAFTLAVFIIYILYGLIIIKFFQIVQMLTTIRLLLYKILAVFAILLGLLNIKDFVAYKPGGILTEMPLFLRPKVKKLILGITSVKGAFIVGAFVTIFLLPCTIGPYIIAGGMLSIYELLATLPLLILYNIIFILPMLAITLFVYIGYTTVEDVTGWKEKNIRLLHLIAGLILFVLGIAMFLGIV